MKGMSEALVSLWVHASERVYVLLAGLVARIFPERAEAKVGPFEFECGCVLVGRWLDCKDPWWLFLGAIAYQ